jgi:hypothetical protein
MKRNPFVTFGLVLACVISISIPVESAVKYAQERETNSSPKEEKSYSQKTSTGPAVS